MSVVTNLQQFGLSEKEAKIYIALLSMDKAVVSDIAKKAGVNRSTAYILLEALKERRLVSVSEKNNISYFSCEPPKRLQEIADKAYVKSKSLVETAKSLAPELSKKYKGVGKRPSMRIYEGNYQKLVADILKKGGKKMKKKDLEIVYNKDLALFINTKEDFAYVIEDGDISDVLGR